MYVYLSVSAPTIAPTSNCVYIPLHVFQNPCNIMQSVNLTLLCPFEEKTMQWAHETWHQLVQSRVETTAFEIAEILGRGGFNTSPQTITSIGKGLSSNAMET